MNLIDKIRKNEQEVHGKKVHPWRKGVVFPQKHCERCGIELTKLADPKRRFCGNYIKKVGCAYQNSLEKSRFHSKINSKLTRYKVAKRISANKSYWTKKRLASATSKEHNKVI